jgi:hypothetical protein
MADVPHAWPAFLLAEQKQALRDALEKNKLSISNVNLPERPRGTLFGAPCNVRSILPKQVDLT